MEVIGDSMSCGADNEGAPGEPGTPANSNAYFSYGAMTARNIDADYMCISWSGKTMDAEHGMPAIYERIVPEYYSKWNYSTWIPDIVVINLSTNDLARKMMKDEAAWIGGIRKVRFPPPWLLSPCPNLLLDQPHAPKYPPRDFQEVHRQGGGRFDGGGRQEHTLGRP